MSLEAGHRLAGRYELLEPIAVGGMARVWRAQDTVLGRQVAVKILHPHLATDRGFLIRFQREAIAAARLSHRSIVAIYDTVSEGGNEAIVMELIAGSTLRQALDDNGPLSVGDTLEIGAQISEALAAAHAGGVVHRDIKPSNILLCADRRVMVTDFGIAKAGEETDLTATGMLLGTAKYLAPEQVAGDPIDPRADLYSLGVVLFEAVTGSAPFQADTDAATALARLHQPAPRAIERRPDLPPSLGLLIDRLMARQPSDRFATALDVRAALSSVADRAEPPSHGDETIVLGAPTRAAADTRHDAPSTGGVPPTPTVHELEDDDPQEHGFLRSERSWIVPALALALIATGLVVAGALFAGPLGDSGLMDSSVGGTDTEPDSADGETITITPFEEFVDPVPVAARALDPFGENQVENPDLVGFGIDGNDSTTWRTETYRNPDYGRLKPGVGYVVDFAGRARVQTIEVETESDDWRIEVFVGDDFGDDPTGWGDPVGVIEGSGRENLELDTPAEGRQLVLWITDHGLSEDGSDPDDEPDHRFELAELTIE